MYIFYMYKNKVFLQNKVIHRWDTITNSFTVGILLCFFCMYTQQVACAEDPDLYAEPEDLMTEELLAQHALAAAAIVQGNQNENPEVEQEEFSLLEDLLVALPNLDSTLDDSLASGGHPTSSGEDVGEGASGGIFSQEEGATGGSHLLGLLWDDYEKGPSQEWPEHVQTTTNEVTSLLQKSLESLNNVHQSTVRNRTLSRMSVAAGNIWLTTVISSLQTELSDLMATSRPLRGIFIQKRLVEIQEQKVNQEKLLEELHEVLEEHPQAQRVIQAQEIFLQHLAKLLEKLEALLEIIEPSDSSVEQGRPPGSPPPPGGGAIGFSFPIQTRFLLSYNIQGEISSLQGMQCLLSDTSEQVSTILRMLVLRSKSFNAPAAYPKKRAKQIYKNKSYLSLQNNSKSSLSSTTYRSQLPLLKSFYVSTQWDSYTSNLEYTLRAANVGFLVTPTDMLNVGLTYQHNKHISKEYYGMQKGWSFGAAKAITSTDSLAAVVAWNTGAVGFTGYLSGCCGWGNMKNTRMVTHAGIKTYSKGSPKITLHGGLIRLGYNFQIVDGMLLTPYVESMFVSSGWSPYEEITGLFPAKISGNNEKVVEKVMGLSHSWAITDNMHVQTWVVRSIKKHRMKELRSQVGISRQYTLSIPKRHNQYIRSEVGLSYENKLLETFSIRLDSLWRFDQKNKCKEQQTGFFFQYSV
ncbi:autotransporter outer membrane beta-barrel domain-containing protein [Lawsonia intracellularis]|uniref:NA n=3 Tax=Lawsonia intracellularis TaxID=29546 RepID=Q1MNU2_LAWIP|nr:hypothetical protein LAW_30038 [Lawsonia intracellularis N343]KAA0204139.1 autotransporter domain-containing protein [Lawsonia intracellularis]CAJ53991.1 NA [Lawsonia intracellularis PHE/MN1-00]MBZ3893251.1 autotransporter outer membrane beta-barrel domain-containing protein [Lawsonia intracellularis]RBN31897.1 autotransporter domain-containing protein [Lawsonia intracellularis]